MWTRPPSRSAPSFAPALLASSPAFAELDVDGASAPLPPRPVASIAARATRRMRSSAERLFFSTVENRGDQSAPKRSSSSASAPLPSLPKSLPPILRHTCKARVISLTSSTVDARAAWRRAAATFATSQRRALRAPVVRPHAIEGAIFLPRLSYTPVSVDPLCRAVQGGREWSLQPKWKALLLRSMSQPAAQLTARPRRRPSLSPGLQLARRARGQRTSGWARDWERARRGRSMARRLQLCGSKL